jgi:excisionase family DNA binding protein
MKFSMKLLMASEVADRLNVKTARVYELARRGMMPAVLLGERQVRFDEEALREWISRGGSAEQKGDRS